MPIFHPPKGKWMRLCEQCGKPFLKERRTQRKCNNCKSYKGGAITGYIPPKK